MKLIIMGQIKLFFLLFLCAISLSAQKKTLTHQDYDLWKSISDVKISNNGRLIVSTILTSTKKGDGYVEIYNTETKQKFTFFNGYDTSISLNEDFVILKKKPKYESIRKEKKAKIKKENLSKDALFIYNVKNNAIHDSILRVKSYKIPEEYNDWMVVENFKNFKKSDEKNGVEQESNEKFMPKSYQQNYALVYNFKTKQKDTILQIKEYAIPKKGKKFYYSTTSKALKKDSEKDKKGKARDIGVYVYDFLSGSRKTIDSSKYIYDKLITNHEGDELAFVSAKDSTSVDSLKFELYNYHKGTLYNRIGILDKNLRSNWQLCGKQSLNFSEDGKRLYFRTKPKIKYDKDTTLLDEEIPAVDVWNWKDKMIQPEQKSKFEELNKKAYASYFDIDRDVYVHLQDKNIDYLIFDKNKNQKYILGVTSSPYDVKRSWDYPQTKDFYRINTNTGDKKLVLQNKALLPYLSPDGVYALYFDIHEQHWFSLHLETLKKTNLTKDLKEVFYDEDDDRPALPSPYGFGGFDKKGNTLLYDKYDIWKVALTGKEKAVNITKNGRESNIEYRTQRLDPENEYQASYLEGGLLITGFDKINKSSGLYVLKNQKLNEKIKPGMFLINRYNKAKNAEVYTYRKQNFNTYPDIYFTNDNFKNAVKITDANPQQKEFKWGTAELFSWNAYDGEKMEGIIYKPENFDPSKKYPLITYFYEKRSDAYRQYSSPQPSASIVNPSYLVSNEYIMFVPDIVYQEGKPGPSAYNCIVSGVEALEELGYIDSKNMALQGQSWGGYQVAYLITVTNKFKAAMAGAPVSNMTSAYGGIRWKSGLSRAFQYEKTQSRIGKNLWDGFDLYIENSPLFGIPKIETPLLMMHNDKDGAVPYYQGIEMFMGMRRLQKPVWLLVYNDEEHNLRKVKNKQDLSIRMMQFFDHYLKDAPAPEWMTKGVPRTQKGKDFGYGTDK
ncbi:S9 family peptidase [Aquimarina sp. AU474]|uniref:alpha/beta hydrolase family protein n=1 Tax=Aquimarina sp. AU474 TaxID=2108529 RepID=UPI000D694EF4|nr:prolyl oligopeptidase family serine peptidase [Aquimarina sp. AU474]